VVGETDGRLSSEEDRPRESAGSDKRRKLGLMFRRYLETVVVHRMGSRFRALGVARFVHFGPRRLHMAVAAC
jgi:hypothetical protein